MSDSRQHVLVTGGLGFIGSRVVERLARQGIPATAVDNGWCNGVAQKPEHHEELERRRQRLRSLTGPGCATPNLVETDLLQVASLVELLQRVQPTHVVHLAGLSRTDLAWADSSHALAPNLVATHNLLDALARQSPIQRLVFASSSMVYGEFEGSSAIEGHPCRPMESYGASKLAGEVLVESWGRRHKVETTIVRPTSVYGPGDFNRRVPELFVNAALSGAPMLLHGDGSQRLDFTYVDDVAEGLVLSLFSPRAVNECFNLAFGEARSLAELADVVRGYLPSATVEFREEAGNRPRRGTLDIGKARRLLGYAPKVPLEEGMRRLLQSRGCEVPAQAIARVSPRPVVALSRPQIGEAELNAVAKTLRSGWLTHGSENHSFESEFAAWHGMREALSLNSCASALLLALKAANITGEVLVPAFTFVATANAVKLAGATPVFVDVEPETMGMDVAAARAAITPRTQALLAVHIGGAPCRMIELTALARQHGLLVIEDVAQALGAREQGRLVGTIGDVSCFSFFPTKNMTTLEGGMLLSNDAALVRRARTLAMHGVERSTAAREGITRPWERPLAEPGYNFRMSAPQAAMGRVQLARLDELNATRVELATRLSARLAGSALAPPVVRADTTHVYQLYIARLAAELDRDELVLELRRRRVESSVHYDTPVPSETPYVGDARGQRFPVAERVCREILSLPMHPGMTAEEADAVAEIALDCLRTVQRRAG